MSELVIACTSCGQSFPIPVEAWAPWVTCPHCGAKVANPLAPARQRPGLAVPGVLLLTLGALGATIGTCLYGAGISFTPRREWVAVWTLVWFGSFVCLVVAGVLLNYAAGRPVARLGDLGARFLGVLGATALVGFAGAIFAFVACTGGFPQ